MAGKKVALTKQQGQRVLRATNLVEHAYRDAPPAGSGYLGGDGGVAPAKTGAGGISAKDGSEAGHGAVTLYSMDKDGVLTLTSTTLTCWNIGDEVDGDKDILVAFGTRGPWVVVDPC